MRCLLVVGMLAGSARADVDDTLVLEAAKQAEFTNPEILAEGAVYVVFDHTITRKDFEDAEDGLRTTERKLRVAVAISRSRSCLETNPARTTSTGS
jgi:hypothetical protein